MEPSDRRSREVDRLLEGLEADQRKLVESLRTFLLEAGPELRETVKWGAPCYVARTNVCAIAVQKDHTNLEFYHGTSLRDPHRVLEGTGKDLRHVKFYGPEALRPAILRPLLREAIVLDGA